MTDIDTLAATIRQRCDADERSARDHWNRNGVTVERFHGTPYDPTRVLAVLRRDRRLLDLLLAEKHRLGESCAARDNPDLVFATDAPCVCGRDARVAAYLGVLAEGYEEGL